MRLSVLPLVFVVCLSAKAELVVVNNAGFRREAVSPGSWAAAADTTGPFAGVTTTTAPGFPLPKSLAGVTVSVDGVDAPVYDVRTSQVTFLIPYATSPGVRQVRVVTGSGTFTGFVRIITSAPGLFTKDAADPPKGAIRNQDGATENTSTTPAKRGEVISIYGTGPGLLNTQIQDGVVPGSNPVVTTKSTPQVYIGGVQAQVQFSGMNPDAPGLWQINAFIPNLPFITGRVPVRVFVDGVDSNEVTVFVQ
jgi:uncharacterized protein (TIGR03437 family)